MNQWENGSSNYLKASLISFLFYNYGFILNKLQKNKESIIIYRKGYQFSMSILGENNILTLKFKHKLYETPSPQKIILTEFDLRKKFSKKTKITSRISIDSKSAESDYSESVSLNNSFSRDYSRISIVKDTLKSDELKDQEIINEKFQNITIRDENQNSSVNKSINSDEKIKSHDINKLLLDGLKKTKSVQLSKSFNTSFESENIKETYFSKENLKFLLKDPITKLINTSKDNNKSFNENMLNNLIAEFESEDFKLRNNIKSINSDSFSIKKNNSMMLIKDNKKNAIQNLKTLPEFTKINENSKNESSRKNKTKLKGILNKAVNMNTKSIENKRGSFFKNIALFTKTEDKSPTNKNYFKNSSPRITTHNAYNDIMNKIDDAETEMEFKNFSDSKEKENILFVTKIENKNEDVKDSLKELMKTFSFKIGIDECDNIYKSETFYIKDEKKDKINIEKQKNIEQKITSEFFKHFITNIKKRHLYVESEKDFIESEIDYNLFEQENNFYKNKTKDENNISEFFDNLINNHSVNDKVFSILRKFDEEILKISSTYGLFEDKNGVYLRMYRQNNQICEIFISLDKIANFLSKMCIYNLLPKFLNLTSINSFDIFMEKIFMYLCFPIVMEDKNFSIAVLGRAMGVFSHKSLEFQFLKTQCMIDFLIFDGKSVRLFINSKTNDLVNLQIDIVTDSQSFDLIFKEIENNQDLITFNNETIVKNYTFFNNKHLNKSGFIPQILIRIQEIFKSKLDNENGDFESFVNKFNLSVKKIQLQNQLNDISFWMISNNVDFKWIVDYYTLKKIEISNKLYYIHKSFTLDEEDYHNLMGSDPRNSFNLLSDREIIITHYLLLNTIKLRNINLKMLTDNNYDSMIKLIKINPLNVIKLSFIINHNKYYFVVTVEFLIYSRINYFFKILITETKTCRCYSKLFLPFQMNSNKFELDEIRKELEETFKINKKSIDRNFRIKLKKIAMEYINTMLQKNPYLFQFENLHNLLDKLSKK